MSSIYVASSWRNAVYPSVVQRLRAAGFKVYDFRNPRPESYGFNWREIDGGWEAWTSEQLREALMHPIAKAGFKSDIDALDKADVVVLVLPSGRSSHMEFGYGARAGKLAIVLLPDPGMDTVEPELMYSMGIIATSLDDVVSILRERIATP